jgi:hypothetical protein
MELLTRARALEAVGRDIIHMEVGEPDFGTPQPIVDAAMHAMSGGKLFYTPALGLPELREAVARFYADRYGIHIPESPLPLARPALCHSHSPVSLIPAANGYLPTPAIRATATSYVPTKAYQSISP